MAKDGSNTHLCLPELISEAFGNADEVSVKQDGPDFAEFYYKGIRIRAYVCCDRKLEKTFCVVMSDGLGEDVGLATHLAYFEGRRCNLYCSRENAIRNLKDARKFIDEGKLIFEYCDIERQRRTITINGKTKDLPFVINGDYTKEAEIMFGEDAKRVLDNLPVYEKQ